MLTCIINDIYKYICIYNRYMVRGLFACSCWRNTRGVPLSFASACVQVQLQLHSTIRLCLSVFMSVCVRLYVCMKVCSVVCVLALFNQWPLAIVRIASIALVLINFGQIKRPKILGIHIPFVGRLQFGNDAGFENFATATTSHHGWWRC